MTDDHITVTGRTMQLIRNEIIEECAKAADAARESDKEHHGIEASIGADIAARRIRALAIPSPQSESGK
jgi:hypothetical protein